MKIHENKNKQHKSKARCGYCREEGHNQYECKWVEADWKFFEKWSFPLDKDGNVAKRGWNGGYKDPMNATVYNQSFSSWFKLCRSALIEQRRRAKQTTKPKAKARRPSKCGFCGEADHNRKKCSRMASFLKKCYRANENWREAAYKEIVEGHGISVGAVVEMAIPENRYNTGETKKTLGIIKSINWDTVNVFSSCSKISDTTRSPFEISVQVGNETYVVDNLPALFNAIGKNGSISWSWSVKQAALTKVITHSPTPLDPEWITSYRESFETLVKKRTLQDLKSGTASEWNAPNLIAHINAWC